MSVYPHLMKRACTFVAATSTVWSPEQLEVECLTKWDFDNSVKVKEREGVCHLLFLLFTYLTCITLPV